MNEGFDSASRQRYRNSGRISIGPTVVWLGVLLAASLSAAAILAIAFINGFYFIGFVPLIISLIVGGAHVGLVHFGKWRNKILAGVVGLLAGSLAYLGYYQIDLAWTTQSATAVMHVEWLPNYISFRMATDVTDSTSSIPTDSYREPSDHTSVFNWIFFAMDWAIMAAVPAVFGYIRATRPYCESCQRWMAQSIVAYEPVCEPALIAMLESEKLDDLAALPRTDLQHKQPATMLMVSYCDPPGSRTEEQRCPVYLSLKTVQDGGNGAFTNFWRNTFRAAIRERSISDRVIAGLLPVVPQLSPLVSSKIQVAQKRKEHGAMELKKKERKETLGGERIRVTNFPENSVLTPSNINISMMLAFSWLIGLFLSLGIALLGALSIGRSIDADFDWRITSWIPTSIGWGLLAVGAALLALSLYKLTYRLSAARDRFFLRKTSEVMADRTGKVVDADDTQAYFCEIVPRENFGKVMKETATDFGFARADAGTGRFLWEGDRRRIEIPLRSLTKCEIYERRGLDGSVEQYMAVIAADDGETEIELPFIPYRAPWRSNATAKKELVVEMLKAIARVRADFEIKSGGWDNVVFENSANDIIAET